MLMVNPNVVLKAAYILIEITTEQSFWFRSWNPLSRGREAMAPCLTTTDFKLHLSSCTVSWDQVCPYLCFIRCSLQPLLSCHFPPVTVSNFNPSEKRLWLFVTRNFLGVCTAQCLSADLSILHVGKHIIQTFQTQLSLMFWNCLSYFCLLWQFLKLKLKPCRFIRSSEIQNVEPLHSIVFI